jgi:hypothetical protein
VITILFKDYTETKRLYHVVTLTDLEKTLNHGICFNDKKTYSNKYEDFHSYIDRHKPENIPEWVVRSKAIFASMNFEDGHKWHSHSAVLGIKIDESLCWVCNENIANFLYEPLILQNINGFETCSDFLKRKGKSVVMDYWSSSCSFKDNLSERKDKKAGYDAEILIMHEIPQEDIEVLYIASDHRFMKPKEWERYFSENRFIYSNC